MQLRDWAERQKLSQRALARLLDVAPSTICRLYGGDRSPSAGLIRKIVIATKGDVSADELVDVPGDAGRAGAKRAA